MPPPFHEKSHVNPHSGAGAVRRLFQLATAVDRTRFLLTAMSMFFLELVIVYIVIAKISYTEIDWSTYMQHVRVYLGGQRNYSLIEGDTGPIVYPAAHLYIYRVFYSLTEQGTNIRRAQYIFAGIYLLNLLLVFRLFYNSNKIPPFVLSLICLTSYRVHSIFLLRLFNDPIAMLLFFSAVNCFVSRRWLFGCLLYSLAVGVKMNILLFSPALFFVLLLSNGIVTTVRLLFVMGFVQITVAIEFMCFDAISYLTKAFELSRVFFFKWTVNWRFLPESVFLDRRFHLALLLCHITCLAIFAANMWFREQGGLSKLLSKLLREDTRIKLSTHDILFALFTSNLIGMSFARSLHYQFYVWYYHSIAYLLFSSMDCGIHNSVMFESIRIFLRLAVLLGIELCWNIYPSTIASSLLLHGLHIAIFVFLIRNRGGLAAKKFS